MTKSANSRKTFLQRFGLFFYDHIKTTASIWIALVVFGVLSYSIFMQRQGFPNVAVPISVSSGTYFVNDKNKVDSDIVKPLSELAMKQASIKTVTSNAGANFYSVIIEFKEGADTPAAQSILEREVKSAGFMPASATIEYKPINASKIINEYDVLLSVRAAPDTSTEELVAYANEAANELKGTVGVNKLTVLDPFRTGKDSSGNTVKLQQSFDRIGVREGGKTIFFPSVEIGVVANAGTDAIRLEHSLNEKLADIDVQKKYVDDTHRVTVSISAGVAEDIESQIEGLQTNLLEGLVVVILISLLLISLRAGIAAALSMTTVLLTTIGLLYAFGITLNTITLFALVLCLGLIVDDTIIMAESIDAGKRSNAKSREIVAGAIKKVARASTAGTITTMLAFAPMLFISGILGSFIRVLPITIITSLFVSLIVSLTIIPFMSRWLLLSDKSKKSRSTNPILNAENWVSDKLAALIRIGNRSRRKAAAVGILGILVSTIFLGASTVFFQKLKFDIFPASKDSDAMSINITYPNGTTIEDAGKITDEANTVLADALGDNLRDVSYLNSGTPRNSSANIRIISFKDRQVTAPQLADKANAAFKDFSLAKVTVNELSVGPPKDDLPFRAQVYGEDTEKTQKLANDIAAYLEGRAVTRQSNNTTAKITRVELSGDSDFVTRNDAKRLIEVQAGFDSDDTSALVSAAKRTVEDEFTPEKIESYGLPKDSVAFNFGNESSNQDSFKSMLFAFPLLLVVMYMLLAFQFKSLLQPLLIFTAIPFSFFGVAAGLHYTNNPLSFFVMIGFFALIGIAVNNTILLTDFANQARRDGHGGFESMALAVKARFRPLLATSLTSVVALIPLALSDPFWEALAFTLIFGLLCSTFLVIISFPYYYLAAEFLRHRYSRVLVIAWLAVSLIGVIITVLLDKKQLPNLFLVILIAMITTWVKGLYAKRLRRA